MATCPASWRYTSTFTGNELVEHFGALRGGVDAAIVASVAERLGVELDRPIGTLSRGNKQKVGLLQAMMHRPELLVLDEPTNGLDPLAQHVVHEMMDEVRTEGRTVFLSSHVLSEVERVADPNRDHPRRPTRRRRRSRRLAREGSPDVARDARLAGAS